MGALFDAVRSAVSAEDAARTYGIIPSGWKRKALCPWHDDKNPSLSFNRKNGRCFCFACNHGGSAVDLTAQIFGLSPLDAARKLCADFHLNVDMKPGPIPMGESLAAKRKREKEEQRKLWSSAVADREFYDEMLRLHGFRGGEFSWWLLKQRDNAYLRELNCE